MSKHQEQIELGNPGAVVITPSSLVTMKVKVSALVRRLLITTGLLAAAVALSPASAGATKRCGVSSEFKYKGYTYSVTIESGAVRCARASRVLSVFMHTKSAPTGWFCTRGHGRTGATPAASCARQRKVVRAYLVAG